MTAQGKDHWWHMQVLKRQKPALCLQLLAQMISQVTHQKVHHLSMCWRYIVYIACPFNTFHLADMTTGGSNLRGRCLVVGDAQHATSSAQLPATQAENQNWNPLPESHAQALDLSTGAADSQPARLQPAMNGIAYYAEDSMGHPTKDAVADSSSRASAGPQLQPVLQHGSRTNPAKRENPLMRRGQQSASPSIDFPSVPSDMVDTHSADSAAALANVLIPSHAPHQSANAAVAPAKASKPGRSLMATAAGASAAAAQTQKKAHKLATEHTYDCQGLKLLSGDTPLHSECLARMSRKPGDSTQSLVYVERANLADNMARTMMDDTVTDRGIHAGKILTQIINSDIG